MSTTTEQDNFGLPWELRLANVTRWFSTSTMVVAENYKGHETKGLIESEPQAGTGIWGYGGDSIGVYINGDRWPSCFVRPAPAKQS